MENPVSDLLPQDPGVLFYSRVVLDDLALGRLPELLELWPQVLRGDEAVRAKIPHKQLHAETKGGKQATWSPWRGLARMWIVDSQIPETIN